MLADRAPSAWLASQMIQRAASTVAASSENVCVQARSSMVRARKTASSVTITRSPSMRAVPSRRAISSGTDAATVAMGAGLLSVAGGGARARAAQGAMSACRSRPAHGARRPAAPQWYDARFLALPVRAARRPRADGTAYESSLANTLSAASPSSRRRYEPRLTRSNHP